MAVTYMSDNDPTMRSIPKETPPPPHPQREVLPASRLQKLHGPQLGFCNQSKCLSLTSATFPAGTSCITRLVVCVYMLLRLNAICASGSLSLSLCLLFIHLRPGRPRRHLWATLRTAWDTSTFQSVSQECDKSVEQFR